MKQSLTVAWFVKRFVVFCEMTAPNIKRLQYKINYPLTPNNHYSGRTAPLTSKRYILYIY